MEDVTRGLRRMCCVSCEMRRRKSRRLVLACARLTRASSFSLSADFSTSFSASFSACLAQLAVNALNASVAAASNGRFLRRSLRDSSSWMQAGRKWSRQSERPSKSIAAVALQDAPAHQLGSGRSRTAIDDPSWSSISIFSDSDIVAVRVSGSKVLVSATNSVLQRLKPRSVYCVSVVAEATTYKALWFLNRFQFPASLSIACRYLWLVRRLRH